MEVKLYKPKKLVPGFVIGKDGKYVAIPDKGFKNCKIKVVYEGKEEVIESWHKAETFRKFHDKFGGSDYMLGYFKWI